MQICSEMQKLRNYLDGHHIEWVDCSTDGDVIIGCMKNAPDFKDSDFSMERTHFIYKDKEWSVIHGYGSYGGWHRVQDKKDDCGMLEVMSEAVNKGEPLGWLKSEEVIKLMESSNE